MIRSFGIISVLLVFALVGADDFVCPDSPPPCEETYYSARLCHQFYLCTSACIPYLFNCSNEELHFDPRNQTCVLPLEYPCEDALLDQPSVFFVARDRNQLLRDDPVSFQVELSDRNNDFDNGNSRFTAPTGGIYYFTMSAGVIDGRRTSFVQSSGADYLEEVAVTRRSRDHVGADTTSRDFIKGMNPDDVISILSEGGLYSDNGLQTSFGGFSLHDTMLNQDAFSVARTTQLTTAGTINYNAELLNEGRHFNLNSGVFSVPLSGLYYFSYSIGVDGETSPSDVSVTLMVDGVIKTEIRREHSNYRNFDTISKSIVLDLVSGQEVHLRLNTGTIESSDLYETCFNGFRYDPQSPDTTNPMPSRAWHVYRTSGKAPVNGDDILDFNGTEVDEGGLWSPFFNLINIQDPGFYLISMNAGAEPFLPVDLRLTVNDVEVLSLLRASAIHSGTDTLSRSAILDLDAGDRVRIEILNGTAVASNEGRLTSFSGIFILNR